MFARLILASAAFVATAASAQTADVKVFDKEVNRGKGQVYYRVEFGTKAKRPAEGSISTMCKGLDTEGAKKFVVFVHYAGDQNSAYATCERMLGQDLKVKAF